MAAGTITLTNNTDAVAGAGTAFLTDLSAGDFIVANVGGIAYTLPVKTVVSDTVLTIASKFSGPTLSGLAWFVVKRDQQAMITAALVAQSTEALRGLNYDKSNWQSVFSADGDITVTLPDGAQFTGPSWAKIVSLVEAIDTSAYMEKGKNLSDLHDKNAARETMQVDRLTQLPDYTILSGPIPGGPRMVLFKSGHIGFQNDVGYNIKLPSDVINIVGPVSQTSGLPTGAIIETGSNANGTYTKFADGTMLCAGALPDVNVAVNQRLAHPITFAAAFATVSLVNASYTPQASDDFYGFTYSYSKNQTGVTLIFRNGPVAQLLSEGAFFAIGRWF